MWPIKAEEEEEDNGKLIENDTQRTRTYVGLQVLDIRAQLNDKSAINKVLQVYMDH